jgi:hypothetical protein
MSLSQPVIDILLAHNPHDLDCIANDAVIDAVDAANTTSVTPADFINGLILVWLLRKLVEAFEKRVKISISLLLAKLKDAA